MLEIVKFVAELAERVGRAEAKLEEAESLIDEMDEALRENGGVDEDADDYDEKPIVALIALDGRVYIRSE